ncbi:hypothetical protein VUR80DRAFT_847 [Thermomyces stellatus]
MTSHGIARTTHVRTEEQRQADLVRIGKYRGLEDQLRERVRNGTLDTQTLDLTTRLLRANPEYYTVWNVRRRCLTACTFSASRRGSSSSKPSPSSTAAPTGTSSCAGSSPSPLEGTRAGRGYPTSGESGKIAEADQGTGAESAAGEGGESRDTERKDEKEAQDHDAQIITSELAFTIPLLLEAPKCYWIWNHRSWTLQQATARLATPAARSIWEAELGLAGKMLAKDQRNFHAWGYRRWVVSQLEGPELGGGSMVESEFQYTTDKIHANLSNFSAWHNRTQLLSRLLSERGASDEERRKFLESELELIRGAVNVGPEDQSLWYYHQFLLQNLVSRDEKESVVPNLGTAERVSYIRTEIEEIKDLLEDYDDIKWIYQTLVGCTLAVAKVDGRELNEEEKEEMRVWLEKLKELDPMRKGRWDDEERRYGLV